MLKSPHTGKREPFGGLKFQRSWCPFLLSLSGEIDKALEVIGQISHAENMEYSSDAQRPQPATVTQVLIDRSGCVFEGGRGTGIYIGTSDIDTVALLCDDLTCGLFS